MPRIEVRPDGSVFDSDAQTLVNTVNCVGIMGAGVALEAKRRFPEMYLDYKARCDAGEVRLGSPYIFQPVVPPWIINFPTKQHWRSRSSLDAIRRGLELLETRYEEWGVTSLAVPALGCGNGGLAWEVVKPVLLKAFAHFTIPVEIFEPQYLGD